MLDGRFDQQFAELFAASPGNEGNEGEGHSFWPLAVACICSLFVLASTFLA